uniref:Putative receptor-binding cancer antigen n=1 Tax=Ornithodoros turicata TaxID=34597 RepID=A0A2R5LH34_9ACAR
MTTLVKSVLANFWKTLLGALGVLRRTFCCFRRRRRASNLPVSVQDCGVLRHQVEDLQSWEPWQDEPLSITVTRDEHDQDDDFFKGMEPTVQHQKKYLPRGSESKEEHTQSRLRVEPQAEIPQSSELGDYEERCGWEDVALALKEQRRAMLEQRLVLHQQHNIQMEQRRAQRDKKSTLAGETTSVLVPA